MAYLHNQRTNDIDQKCVGFVAYLGASTTGTLVVNGAGKTNALLPRTPLGSPGLPTN